MSYFEKSIGRGNFWTLIIGLTLTAWGAIALVLQFTISKDIPGSYWLLIPGGIMLIAGISNIFTL